MARRLDPRYHIPAKVEKHDLEVALGLSGITVQHLQDSPDPERGYPELTLPPGVRLTCYQGLHRVRAAAEVRPELFEQLEVIVTEKLDNKPSEGATESPSPPDNGGNYSSLARPGSEVKGTQSLRVLSECVTFALSIFQSYEHAIPEAVKLLPLIRSILRRQAKAQEPAHKVSPDVKNRTAFNEFIAVQVNTVKLFSYLLRQSPELAESQQFEDCQGTRPETFKELIFAVRWMINDNFSKLVFVKIHDFLDESVLENQFREISPKEFIMVLEALERERSIAPGCVLGVKSTGSLIQGRQRTGPV